MKKDNIFNYIHNIGLILLVISAFVILVMLNNSIYICILFCIGVLMLSIGRFLGPSSDYIRSNDQSLSISFRRLYRQRLFAVCLLYISILLLFIHEGFYWGYYIRRSLWFLPFLIFTIIEIYTTFRLSSLDKNSKNDS